jgi:esterase/lipase
MNYQSVLNSGLAWEAIEDPDTGEITLRQKQIVVVGQSLGGALAGFVGSLYGLETYVYDTAPFLEQPASNNGYERLAA